MFLGYSIFLAPVIVHLLHPLLNCQRSYVLNLLGCLITHHHGPRTLVYICIYRVWVFIWKGIALTFIIIHIILASIRKSGFSNLFWLLPLVIVAWIRTFCFFLDTFRPTWDTWKGWRVVALAQRWAMWACTAFARFHSLSTFFALFVHPICSTFERRYGVTFVDLHRTLSFWRWQALDLVLLESIKALSVLRNFGVARLRLHRNKVTRLGSHLDVFAGLLLYTETCQLLKLQLSLKECLVCLYIQLPRLARVRWFWWRWPVLYLLLRITHERVRQR